MVHWQVLASLQDTDNFSIIGFTCCLSLYQCFFFLCVGCFVYLFLDALGLCCCAWAFLVVANGGYSLLWCADLSLQWLLLLWSMGSRHVGFSSCGSWAPEHRLSSCGTWAQLLCGMWDLPRPGLEPMSPALAGGFLTTVPPGKSCISALKQINHSYFEFIV